MKKRHVPLSVPYVLAACVLAGSLAAAQASKPGVTLLNKPAEQRVDVLIDGQPFTSYIYPSTQQKPVLYPIRSASGVLVTRGYPMDPRRGERADHPHHVGHWFNYGDVNGFDFWGHSSETPAANKPKMGTIVHKEVTRATNGAARGELLVKADWVAADGSTLLRESTRFAFSGAAGRRVIDRDTTWTAAEKPVTFKDTKEGAFGIRVARALDHPSEQAEMFVGASGQREKGRPDNTGVTGNYIASDGKTGEAVWGTRGPWMGLTGTVEGKPVTLAILDHPSNHGYPTYWHARGYGLFAANPLGQQGYDPKQQPVSFTLQPGQSVTFHHRILGTRRTADAGATAEGTSALHRGRHAVSVASGRVRVLYVVTLVAGLTLIGTEPAGAQQTAAGCQAGNSHRARWHRQLACRSVHAAPERSVAPRSHSRRPRRRRRQGREPGRRGQRHTHREVHRRAQGQMEDRVRRFDRSAAAASRCRDGDERGRSRPPRAGPSRACGAQAALRGQAVHGKRPRCAGDCQARA